MSASTTTMAMSMSTKMMRMRRISSAEYLVTCAFLRALGCAAVAPRTAACAPLREREEACALPLRERFACALLREPPRFACAPLRERVGAGALPLGFASPLDCVSPRAAADVLPLRERSACALPLGCPSSRTRWSERRRSAVRVAPDPFDVRAPDDPRVVRDPLSELARVLFFSKIIRNFPAFGYYPRIP